MPLLPVLGRADTRRRPQRAGSLALALLLAAVACLPAAAAAQDAAADVTRVRIGVTRDGVTVITPADLANAQVNVSGADPRTFALSSLGRPVAIYLTGADDGRFDGSDRLYFFGEKFRGPEMDQKYTDERVYWLDIGGAAGPRMAAVDATPRYDRTPPADFATTLRAEESLVWWTLYSLDLAKETQDTWFWKRLQLVSGSVLTSTLPYTVPYPANAAATLRFEEISYGYNDNVNPDHRTKAAFNGKEIVDQTWDGQYVRQGIQRRPSPGALQHGTNTLAVGMWAAPGTTSDEIYVNYWEVDYRRLFRAWDNQLDFRAETGGIQEYRAGGFASPDVLIWDVTDPSAPVRLTTPGLFKTHLPLVFGGPGGALGQDGNSTLRFRANGAAGSRYWLQTAASVQRPASLRLRPPTDLRSPAGGADAVIVTSAVLRGQAERLADWHRSHGRRALVVDIQDAYDEFNDGIFHPKAVQAMMKWAGTNWAAPAPAYLTFSATGSGILGLQSDDVPGRPESRSALPGL